MSGQINVNGSCHCGKITISGIVTESMVIACHCTDCQQFSGGPFRPVAIIKQENLKIDGEVAEYTKVADSGNERIQGFCGNCGCQIYARDPDKSVFNVRTGFLEQHQILTPTKHIFGQSKVPWIDTISEAKWYEAGPESKEMMP
jgi:hypothetical protein